MVDKGEILCLFLPCGTQLGQIQHLCMNWKIVMVNEIILVSFTITSTSLHCRELLADILTQSGAMPQGPSGEIDLPSCRVDGTDAQNLGASAHTQEAHPPWARSIYKSGATSPVVVLGQSRRSQPFWLTRLAGTRK